MNALVMYDHQTNTLWSQFLRKGVKGELKGVELGVVPATQTTWAAWAELHPDTLVLDKGSAYTVDSYERYYTDSGRSGIHGQFNPDDRLPPKELVVGIDLDGKTKAYPFSALTSRQVVNDAFSDEDILIFFDPATGTALAFDRRIDGTALTFRIEAEPAGAQTVLIDDQTGSRWSAFTGRATDGALKGSTLDRIPSHLSFWFAWTDYNPQTALYAN